MNLKILTWVLLASIGLVFLAYPVGKFYYSQKYQVDKRIDVKLINQTRFVTEREWLEYLSQNTVVKPKTFYLTKVIHNQVNIDSLYQEAKEFWFMKFQDSLETDQRDYVAEIDTTYEDNSAILKASFVSPIPIHPKSNFIIKELSVKKKETTINNNTEIQLPPKPEGFFDKFNISISSGFGYGIINKQVDFYVGVGLSIKLKNLFGN